MRGGTPDQNLTVMDGVEIHNPYRLFGLVSAFNPETVDRFELTAGGFGAAYGDRLSSILVVDNRSGRPDLQGSTSASFTDGNVVLEGPAPAGGSWLVTGRRTYYDLVANLVSDQDFPSFTDVQAQAEWEFGAGHRLSVLGLSSRENADFQLDEDDGRDSGRFTTTAGNDLGSVRLDARVGAAASSSTIVSWYRNTDLLDVNAVFESDSRRSNTPDDADANALSRIIFDRALAVRDFSLRQELAFQLTSAHALDVGVELHRLATGVRQTISGDRNDSAANPTSVRGGAAIPDALDSALSGTRGGLWIQDRYAPSPRFSVEPGLRLDWSTVNGAATISPRLAATVALGRAGRLRAAGGLYTQSPGYEKLIQSDYFLDLSPARVAGLEHERATHLVVGYERDLGLGVLARVEGYYKAFDDLIVGRLETAEERNRRLAQYDFPAALRASIPAATTITSVPVNGGKGTAYGVDAFLARTGAAARLAGWLSYAWGRADRETYGLRYPFEYDRRHAFNAVGRYRLGERWSVAATAQIATGFAYTPAAWPARRGGGRCRWTPRAGARRGRGARLRRGLRRAGQPAPRPPAVLRARRPAGDAPAGRRERPLVLVPGSDQSPQPRQPGGARNRVTARRRRLASPPGRDADGRVSAAAVVRRPRPLLSARRGRGLCICRGTVKLGALTHEYPGRIA